MRVPILSGDESTVAAPDATTPESAPVATAGARGVLAQGSQLGRYEVVRMLGRGGMGVVYVAHDPQLDRDVAIKLLHGGRAAPDSLIHEAKALAKLDDRHVVQVFDAGTHDGEVFIAMQLVDGEDLASALAKRQPKLPQIISWFVDAARGLAAAHAAGLVHRDFKPSNVLIDRRGRVAVTDFGLAVSTAESDGARSGFAGTPVYMAPEQHALEPATEATDQFSFCAALWEALFGQHPYIPRGGATSAAEAGMHITTGPLIAPPRDRRVPKQVHDVLTRGLSRAPKDRWPAITDVVARLAPSQRRRTWPLVAIGVAAAAAGGVGAWMYAASHHGASCQQQAGDRLAAAWNPVRAETIRGKLAASQRSYGGAVADRTIKALDGYGTRWRELAIGVCQSDGTPDFIARQRTCLDAHLDALQAAAGVLESDAADVVDHANDVTDGLPALAECTDRDALLAVASAPPAAKAAQIAALDRDIDRVIAQQRAGSTHTQDAARSLAARADALGWPPAMARAHIALGTALSMAFLPGALDELVSGAQLAIANHLDSDAIRGWIHAIDEGWYENKPDVIEMVIKQARTAAARANDAALSLELEITYGRALIQMQRWNEGIAICRSAILVADKLANQTDGDLARDCLWEGLLPAGKLDELRDLTRQRIAWVTERYGPDAPRLATYDLVMAGADAARGDLVNARAEIDRAAAVTAKAYPDGKTLRNVEVLRTRADIEVDEGKAAQGLATYRQALALANGLEPKPIVELAQIDTGIAELVVQSGNRDAALAAYDEAIAAARAADADSMSLAMLLLNYGQLVGDSDFAAGLRAFEEARQILDRKHDPRVSYASAAMAVIESRTARWADARRHAEQAVAFAAHDPDAYPANTAELQFILARALVQTKGDKQRARQLAGDARTTYGKLGPSQAKSVRTIDKWLAALR